MCNRICLSTDIGHIRTRFAVTGDMARLRPHWNIGAGQVHPVIRLDPILQRRRLDPMRWGLIPALARNSLIVRSNLDVSNACDEVSALIQRASRRCLIPVDNFYEWRLRDRQPFAVALASRQIMALAGLWDLWISPLGEGIYCFAILTTDANELLAPLCKRMPAILAPEDWDRWLGPELTEQRETMELLRPCASDLLNIWPVDRRIGNARNDTPEILLPIARA